ncbi:MAG TPA: hypothetical protein VKR32_02975, partial [Puia sp.]|nr:hypothetical protein [Puia sp.]
MNHDKNHVVIRTIRPGDNVKLASIVRTVLAEFGANHRGTVYYDPTTDRLYEMFLERGSVYFVALVKDQIV